VRVYYENINAYARPRVPREANVYTILAGITPSFSTDLPNIPKTNG